jgi:SAM-dependent methyltransferase
MTSDTPEVPEPLLESAPLANRWAATFCPLDPSTGTSCAWYHGFWQYLRAMGLAPTLGEQGSFLLEKLRPLARVGGGERVLVSACADYSLPAHVIHAYRDAGADLALTVVDRCETPLRLTRWYAERQGWSVVTHRHDIVSYQSAAAFSVIVANSVLGYFEPGTRPALFAAWSRLLRPGGIIILTNRFRRGSPPGLVGFSPAQVDDFVAVTRLEAERWRPQFGFDPRQVAVWARTYAERFQSHSISSVEEVELGLRAAGFALDHLDVVTVPGRAGGPVSGPSIAAAAEQLRVVATRPAALGGA